MVLWQTWWAGIYRVEYCLGRNYIRRNFLDCNNPGEIFWVGVFQVGIFQVAVIRGGNFPGGNCLGGSYPGWELSKWKLSWVGIFFGGGFPGGIYPGEIIRVGIFRVGVFLAPVYQLRLQRKPIFIRISFYANKIFWTAFELFKFREIFSVHLSIEY